MTLDLRDTLSSVCEALPVPEPDQAAFRRRVADVRRRRTARRVAGAVAAVAVVATGATLAVHDGRDPAGPQVTKELGPEVGDSDVPVVVNGHLRTVSVDGALGPVGPAVASILGTTPHGVVVLSGDGVVARLDEQTRQLNRVVPGTAHTAYLAGGDVVYEDDDGLIRVFEIESSPDSIASAEIVRGELMGAGAGRYVVADSSTPDPNRMFGASGRLVSHDAAGAHELDLGRDVTAIDRVETGGDVIAVQTDDGVVFVSPDGHPLAASDYDPDRLGALAPDGRSFALQADSRRSVELLDPVTLEDTHVDGPSGTIVDLGWAPDGDLLVVVHRDVARTLWRCPPDGIGCVEQVDDPTGTLRLR
jgi:hypothetical protein